MAGQDGSNDFLAAFGIGAVLGIGAALLLRPARDPRRRLVKRARPHAKKLRRSARRTRKAVREAAGSGAGMTGDAIEAGRELLAEFRAEADRILERARNELHEMAVDHDASGRHPALDAGGEG